MNYIDGIKFCTQALLESLALAVYKNGGYQVTVYGHPEVLRSSCSWEKWRYRFEPSNVHKGLHRVIYMSDCGVSVKIVYTFDSPFDKADTLGWI